MGFQKWNKRHKNGYKKLIDFYKRLNVWHYTLSLNSIELINKIECAMNSYFMERWMSVINQESHHPDRNGWNNLHIYTWLKSYHLHNDISCPLLVICINALLYLSTMKMTMTIFYLTFPFNIYNMQNNYTKYYLLVPLFILFDDISFAWLAI